MSYSRPSTVDSLAPMLLHVHTWGDPDAPAVVCVHGVSAHGRRFRKLAEERLAGNFHVLAPDLRGHGHSDYDPPWDIETHLDDLRETIEATGVERAPWIGHSFGGRLVLELAAQSPELLASVVPLDPAIQILPHVGFDFAQDAARDHSFASVDEAIESRLGKRSPDAEGVRRGGGERAPRPVAGRSVALAVLPLGRGHGVQRALHRAAPAFGSAGSGAARPRRVVRPGARGAARRVRELFSASSSSSSGCQAGTSSTGTRSRRPRPRSKSSSRVTVTFPTRDTLAATVDPGGNIRGTPGESELRCHKMRAPRALATSSTASLAVWFSRSRIGLTSTTSRERARPDSAMSSSARCASR